jgi:hypothetical protein
VWKGGVPLPVAAELYGVFLTSTILYHVTGLVAGTVVRNRRWAFLISMAVIFLLYTVVPQVARFGLVYFKYLTIRPVFEECLPFLIPRDAGAIVEVTQALLGEARFFGLNFPEAVFTVLSQAVFILTGIAILWRRWRRAESHLLGKPWAVGFFVWIQVLLLGNALPLIESGSLFPSREFRRIARQIGQSADWRPVAGEAVLMAGIYGLFSLAMLWVLTLMITPKAETQIRGRRRALKLQRKGMGAGSDPATAFPWVALMVAAGTAGWYLFTKSVLESHWFPGSEVTPTALAAFALVFVTGGLGFHALLESRGGRTVGLAAILAGALPVLVAAVILAVNDRFLVPATWLAGSSPATGPVYASISVLPLADTPRDLARAIPRAFWFYQGLALMVSAWLLVDLRRSRREFAKRAASRGDRTESRPPPPPPSPGGDPAS